MSFTVKTTRTVDESQMEDLLATVFETSACAYWLAYEGHCHVGPNGRKKGPTYTQEIPLLEGGWVALTDKETCKTYRLNRRRIQKGLQVMAYKEPTHFSDLVTDNADGSTADVFLQCCLLGEVLYG